MTSDHLNVCRFFAILCCLAVTACSGCNSQSDTGDRSGKVDAAESVSVFHSMLKPHRYGRTTTAELVVNRINGWLRASHPDWKPEAKSLALLPKTVRDRALATGFDDRDADFLRDAILLQQIAQYVTASAQDDLARVTELFEYVVTAVAIDESIPEQLGMDPFTALLLGRGRAEHRAWVFGGLVRQLKLNAFVLTRKTPDAGSLIVGVALGGEAKAVRLFDCKQGVPLSAVGAGDAMLPVPATLAEKPEFARDVVVRVIGESSLWSPRTQKLQVVFSGGRFAVIHASAVGEGGAIEVSAKAGGWPKSNVGVWEFGDAQRALAANRSEKHRRVFDAVLKPLQAPFSTAKILKSSKREDREENKIAGVAVEKGATFGLWDARVSQLIGEHTAAVNDLNVVRQARRDIDLLDREQQRAQETADELARLWGGWSRLREATNIAAEKTRVAQLQSAARGFGAYRDRSLLADDTQPPLMESHSIVLQAFALAYAGNTDKAADVISTFPTNSPDYAGTQQLARHWRAQNKSAGD